MKAKITISYELSNICSKEDLVGSLDTLEKMVTYLIKEEGLFGLVDEESLKIISVEELPNK